MFDITRIEGFGSASVASSRHSRLGFVYPVAKRGFDTFMSLMLLPCLLSVALVLILLNPFYNAGPLFYIQKRMGRHCEPFIALKFRSMTDATQSHRSAECPLEVDRITRLGGFLRKTRLDELPQIINVLRGEMSLIGPRPDNYEHALYFAENVNGYRERHSVRPGISGLAQTELGYIEGVEATRRKVQADLYYIANAGFRLDTWILVRTLGVVVRRGGA